VVCLVAGACSGGKTKTATTTPPSSAASTSSPSSLDSLLAASHSEKGLVIYGNPPTQLWKPVIAAFNKQYPWISVSPNDVTDTVVFSKYAAEHGTGVRTADVVVASAPNLWGDALKNGILQDFTPPGLTDLVSARYRVP
jgi:iron(III) transport system substrate-binding protein